MNFALQVAKLFAAPVTGVLASRYGRRRVLLAGARRPGAAPPRPAPLYTGIGSLSAMGGRRCMRVENDGAVLAHDAFGDLSIGDMFSELCCKTPIVYGACSGAINPHTRCRHAYGLGGDALDRPGPTSSRGP